MSCFVHDVKRDSRITCMEKFKIKLQIDLILRRHYDFKKRISKRTIL